MFESHYLQLSVYRFQIIVNGVNLDMQIQSKISFDINEYMSEYYSSLGQENGDAGSFLLSVNKRLPKRRNIRMLDAGCGPTLLYWLVFSPNVKECYGFDIQVDAVNFVEKQIADVAKDRFCPALIEAAQKAIYLGNLDIDAKKYLMEKSLKIQSIKVANLCERWPYKSGAFDVVQSCFAVECLPNFGCLDNALHEAYRLLCPGGFLNLVNVSRGTHWLCGGKSYKLLHLSPSTLGTRLRENGFEVVSIEEIKSVDKDTRDQGYTCTLRTHAIRR